MPKVIHSLITIILSILLSTVSWYAGASSSYIRIKSQPDVYQYSPDPLPQIPLNVFYRQQFQKNVDPRTGHLVFTTQDFALPQRDEITLDLTRHYDSGSDHQSVLGKGWFFGFESRLSEGVEDSLVFTDYEGKTHSFEKELDGKYVSYANGRLEITKSDGVYTLYLNKNKLSFREDGKLIESQGKNGSTISYFYEAELLTKVDLFGRAEVLFEYRADNVLDKIILPTGRAISYEFDEKNQLNNVVDPIGQSIKYAYNPNGLLSGVNYFDSAELEITYKNDSAVLNSLRFPDGTVTSYDFVRHIEDGKKSSELTLETEGRISKVYIDGNIVKYVDPLNQESFVEFHERFENLVFKIKNNAGETVNYEYNKEGKVRAISNNLDMKSELLYTDGNVTEIVLPRGALLKFEYDDKGNLSKFWDQNGDLTKFFYTELGQLARVVDPRGKTDKYTYKRISGLLARHINSYGVNKRLEYDDLYRLRTEFTNDRVSARYGYNDEERSLVISGMDRRLWTRIDYGVFGRPERVITHDGKETTYEHDVMGQLVSVKDAGGLISNLSYDSFGNLSDVKLPNKLEHKFQYDALNRVSALIDPQGNKLSFHYDENGRLVQEKLGNLPATQYTYDDLGRVTSLQYTNDESSEALYEYNLDNELVVAKRDDTIIRFGRDLESQALVYSFERDKNTSKTSKSNEVTDSNNYKVKWFSNGTIRSILYPSGMFVTYKYLKNGDLNKITIKKPNQDAQEIAYDNSDDGQKINYSNGVTTTFSGYTRDQQVYVSSIQTTNKKGNNLAAFEYKYGNDGNLAIAAFKHGNEKTAARVFEYDENNQLSVAIDENGQTKKYTYDENYNRISEIISLDDKELSKHEYSYKNDRLISDVENRYEYDEYGNLVKKIHNQGDVTYYEYTPAGELIRVSKGEAVTEFKYDALGNRSKKIVRTADSETETTIDFIRDHRIAEINDNETKEYVYAPGIDNVVAVNIISSDKKEIKGKEPIEKKSSTYFYHTDRSNSIVLITDSEGQVVSEYAYSEFGESLKSNDSKNINNSFGYTGRYQEKNIDLYDYRTRFYDPSIGRFTTEDRYLAYAGSPQSYNRYTYVFNNPNRYRDPNGEFINFGTAAIGAAIGGFGAGAAQAFRNYTNGDPLTKGLATAAGRGALIGGVAGLTGGVGLLAGNAVGSAVAVKVGGGVIGAVVGGVAGSATAVTVTAVADTAVGAAYDATVGDGLQNFGHYAGEVGGNLVGVGLKNKVGGDTAIGLLTEAVSANVVKDALNGDLFNPTCPTDSCVAGEIPPELQNSGEGDPSSISGEIPPELQSNGNDSGSEISGSPSDLSGSPSDLSGSPSDVSGSGSPLSSDGSPIGNSEAEDAEQVETADVEGVDAVTSDGGDEVDATTSEGVDEVAARTDDAETNDAETNDAETNDAETNDAETNDAETNIAETNGAETNGAETNIAETNGAETNGAETNIAETNGAETNIAETNGAETNGAEVCATGGGSTACVSRIPVVPDDTAATRDAVTRDGVNFNRRAPAPKPFVWRP